MIRVKVILNRLLKFKTDGFQCWLATMNQMERVQNDIPFVQDMISS